MRFVRHHLLSLGQLVLIAFVFAFAQVSFSARVDPSTVPQTYWFETALGEYRSDAALPRKHKVVFESCDEGPWRVVLSYLPPPIGEGGKGEVQGKYDLKTGTIKICGKMAVLQAGLAEKLQPTFRWTLRHEYGHALFADWMKAKHFKPNKEPFILYRQPGAQLVPKGNPKELQPVVAEYNRVPSTIYGLPHFTSSFDEYIAQSYARFVSGQDVPKHTAGFLEDAIAAR